MDVDFEKGLDWRDHVTVNPDILVGKPIIKGTRISVELLLDRLGDGWSMEEILESYPHIKREDVQAAVKFATELFKEERFEAIAKARG
ncbi:MAG: DUF433 domain-containing protein [Stagnimonas sp.]|nr:DUF433 domain-containing protein [Stagnimonas sp.]